MNINGHYNVSRSRWGDVQSLDCAHCSFRQGRFVGQPRTSRSGLGRYNRMLGHMRKHLHEAHRANLAEVKTTL